MSKDYYKTLGVEKNASAADIKKAFYKLASEHHPDKPTGNEAKFKEINEAYQTLSDDTKRAQYDRFGSDGPQMGGGGNPFGGNPFGAGFDFSQFGGGNGGFEFNFGGDGPIDLGDVISEMFGGGSRRNPRGRNVQVDTTLTFAESVLGCTREIEVPNYVDGKQDGKRKLSIQIPAGVDNGMTLEMQGEGEKMANGRHGNLHIVVRVGRHPLFRKEGRNLVMDHDVKLTEAISGGEFTVELVDGKRITIDIPAGLQPGQTLRVRNKGVPSRAGTGDLLVATHIQIPKKLSKEAKKALDVLKAEGL